MTVLSKIRVMATKPHDCSYLDDREATTLFVDPTLPIEQIDYQELSDIGFRRSGRHYYRPHCATCNDCIAARVPAATFSRSRRQQRVCKRNHDIIRKDVVSIDTDEHYRLYETYIAAKHTNGDMFPATREQYREFLVEHTGYTKYTEYRLAGELVAISIFDQMPYGLSAIYTAYSPQQSARSLGNLVILDLIERAQQERLDFLYLGYWIRDCRKMTYKIDFRPVELLINGHWRTLS